MGKLLDVVNQAEQLPLGVDLDATPLREPVEPLVVTDIGEYRFDDREALTVQGPTFGRVDALLHSVRV